MNSFDIYRMYVAVKKHFHSKHYDYFKYEGKVKVSRKSFEDRNDKLFFKKLTKSRDPLMMLVYNLIENDKWIGEIVVDKASVENYLKHKKINQSLTYELEKHLTSFESITSLIDAEQNTHPLIVRKYLQGEVPLEILVVICDVIRPLAYWNRKFGDDIVLENVIRQVTKFKPFMIYERGKLKNLVKQILPK